MRVVVVGEIKAAAEVKLLGLMELCGGALVRVGSVATVRTSSSIDVEELDGVLAPWLASMEQCVVITRPDNYVYGTAKTPEEAIVMLQQLLSKLTV